MTTTPSPQTEAQLLTKLLESVQRQEQRQLELERTLKQLEQTVAMIVEISDDHMAKAIERGVDPAQRAVKMLELLERLSAPERLSRLERLIDDLEHLPGHLATVGNILDGWAAALMEQGVDLHAARANGGRLLVAVLKTLQSDRAGDFDMISPRALDILNRAGAALGQDPQLSGSKIGMMKLLKVMRDPHIQRALDFGIQFGQRFGQLLQPQLPPSQDL